MTDKSMIYQVALEIYRRYDIKSFPFDIFSLVIQAGFDIHKYSSLKPAKFEKVRLLSDSACLVGSTIYYNDAQIPERIRFSIAHELGHYFLQTADEDLADTFAAQFLAPAPLIRARGYRTSDEVQEAFRISTTAANRALFVGKKWIGLPTAEDSSGVAPGRMVRRDQDGAGDRAHAGAREAEIQAPAPSPLQRGKGTPHPRAAEDHRPDPPEAQEDRPGAGGYRRPEESHRGVRAAGGGDGELEAGGGMIFP